MPNGPYLQDLTAGDVNLTIPAAIPGAFVDCSDCDHLTLWFYNNTGGPIEITVFDATKQTGGGWPAAGVLLANAWIVADGETAVLVLSRLVSGGAAANPAAGAIQSPAYLPQAVEIIADTAPSAWGYLKTTY
jgi:hypothetical protein